MASCSPFAGGSYDRASLVLQDGVDAGQKLIDRPDDPVVALGQRLVLLASPTGKSAPASGATVRTTRTGHFQGLPPLM